MWKRLSFMCPDDNPEGITTSRCDYELSLLLPLGMVLAFFGIIAVVSIVGYVCAAVVTLGYANFWCTVIYPDKHVTPYDERCATLRSILGSLAVVPLAFIVFMVWCCSIKLSRAYRTDEEIEYLLSHPRGQYYAGGAL